MYKVLIVEDDKTIADALVQSMGKWGFEAKAIEDFNRVTDEFVAWDPHLILLDITLPLFNGYYWCGQIRKRSNVPIIFLSSASDNMNIVMAMNMGGDDFIAKPFDLTVLIAKVQAMLRRTYDFTAEINVLEHNGVMLNLKDTTLLYQDQLVELTKNEFKILQLLMENKGSIVSREQIMVRLWDSDCFIDDNTLTVNMTRLRKKLEEIGVIHFITTKKGLGYMI